MSINNDLDLDLSLGTSGQALIAVDTTTIPSFSSAIGFLALGGGGSLTGDGTNALIRFNAVFFDTGSNFNTSTHLFTAPITGVYKFTGNCFTSSYASNNTSVSLYFQVNGGTGTIYNSGVTNPYISGDGASGTFGPFISAIIYLNASDTVGYTIKCSGHSSKNVGLDVAYFYGALIR